MKELIIIAVIISAGLSPPVSSTNIIFMLMDDVSAKHWVIAQVLAQFALKNYRARPKQ